MKRNSDRKRLRALWWVAADRMKLSFEDIEGMKSETMEKLTLYALRKDGLPE